MEIRFIGQGYNRDVGSSLSGAIIEALNNNSYNTFKCLVAFASHTGVTGLKQQIINSKSHITNFRIIVGIDQFGTSREALEALLEWEVDVFIFYTTQQIIFHPKIYLFSGDEISSAIIGSNNLTQKGLGQNIEGAIQILCDSFDDVDLIEQIEGYYDPILNDTTSPYLRQLTSDLISQLVSSGLVKNEAQTRAHYRKRNPNRRTRLQGQSIQDLFGSLPLQSLHPEFRPTRISVQRQPAQDNNESSNESDIETTSEEYRYVAWRKLNLPRSDVLYAPEGTNPTGGLRLTQAGFRDNNGNRINQTSYFRNTVFGDRTWIEVSQNPYRELANVNFQLFIDGQFKGVFELEIRHKPSGEAGQNNYTTSISWGDAANTIRENDLRGKNLVMYYPSSDDGPFTIVIE